jgi:hypothetical protein
MSHGLHEYLLHFLGNIGRLGEEINDHFLTPVYA